MEEVGKGAGGREQRTRLSMPRFLLLLIVCEGGWGYKVEREEKRRHRKAIEVNCECIGDAKVGRR